MNTSQSVFITGASSGLGKQMAQEFASRGYNLALTARRVDILAALKQELERKFKIKVFVAGLDVQDPQRIRDVLAAAASELGGIDKVLANAGIGYSERIPKRCGPRLTMKILM